jgi:hypothetical protein
MTRPFIGAGYVTAHRDDLEIVYVYPKGYFVWHCRRGEFPTSRPLGPYPSAQAAYDAAVLGHVLTPKPAQLSDTAKRVRP